MAPSHCPHCGSSVLIRSDVFCSACQEPLDELLEQVRTPTEQAKFRQGSAENVMATLNYFSLGKAVVIGAIVLIGLSMWLLRRVFQPD